MGRHSAAPGPRTAPSLRSEPTDRVAPAEPIPSRPRARPRLLDQTALALAAAGGTGAVMAWADAAPLAAVLAAVGTAVVVLVAARMSATLPGPSRTRGGPAKG